jgi:hypothetical protein
MTAQHRVLTVCVGLFIVALGCGGDLGPIAGDESTTGQTSATYPQDSPERLLAQIDANDGLLTDGQIRPYARALDLLEGSCTESRTDLADLAAFTLEQAREANVTTDTLSVMRDVQGAATVGDDEMDCQALFAAVLTILRSSAP